MGKILLIYAAIIFIGAVVLFTYSELKKDSDEPEPTRWMKIFSVILLVFAIACFVGSRISHV